jgi:spore coat protein CotH
MEKMTSLGATLRAAGLLLVAGVTLWADPAVTQNAETGKTAKNTNADLFGLPQVPTIRIDIPKEGMDVLRRYNWRWGGGVEGRQSVRATVTEGARIYTNVALHLKGAAGSFRPIDANPALTLNFDKFVKDQSFHGVEKFSLNNSVQDPSYVSEQLCRELFEAAGVPVPRATHAKVVLNGRDLGLYVLTEGFNKQFLKRYFKNTKGNLYDGGFLKDITEHLATNSGDNPKDQSDLKALAAAALEPNPATRWARLQKVLDVDRFISLIAMEVLLVHWDGYAMNKNNYRVFDDLGSGKMVFMPHGVDQMFGVMRVGPDLPIFPPMEGMVAQALVQTLEGRQQYLSRMTNLMASLYKVEALTNRVQELAAKIRPVLAERSADAARRHEYAVAGLCSRIVQREKSLKEQFAALGRTLKFDSSSMARLSQWKSKADFGKPALTETTENGKRVMRISAAQGSSVGSWRTKVLLEGGHYRIEGKAKTQEITPDPGDPRAGVGFRTANRRFVQKLTGTTDWKLIAFEFDVDQGMEDVELICELRARQGEAWFDVDSIRLMRK